MIGGVGGVGAVGLLMCGSCGEKFLKLVQPHFIKDMLFYIFGKRSVESRVHEILRGLKIVLHSTISFTYLEC